jgi:hypothetical protein
LAVGVDLRMPTGDAENLLGLGTAQTALTFIASSKHGRYAPHVNFGYTFSGESDVIGTVADELGYRAGVEIVMSPSITLAADLIGRALLDSSKLVLGSTTVNYRDASGATLSTSFEEFQHETGTLNSVTVALGGKVNVKGQLLVTANVLIPANWDGIRARFTPVIGFEYSFDTIRK